jgi:ribosomal protein S11
MASSSVAGIITATASGITAIALLFAALPALIKVLREQRRNGRRINEVHVIVNQQKTDMTRYQEALIRALDAAGIEIPVDQSRPPEPI